MNVSEGTSHEVFCPLALDIIAFVQGTSLWASFTEKEVAQLQAWKAALSRERPTGKWLSLWRQAVVLVAMLDALRIVTVVSRQWALALDVELAVLLAELSS